ncbi:MAG: helix-turn-helix domain-containing protein [Methylobacterium sp.]|nr:helix-turn-helix domain-containing protein [Methylobacterium sp.]MCA3647682.1 helix-turn-helix domain-containing protein [Methylobacterium sp.]MCA3651097.1 helix-turn-helix domain-containing protein [Methylobacterium sp.]MCA4921535.1 helix-turn-helix domain-containing protein [Methylobacterium sp.]
MRTNIVDLKTEQPKKLLLDIVEVCEMLGCSRALVYNLIRRGELRSVKLGRATRFRPADLEALIDRLASR